MNNCGYAIFLDSNHLQVTSYNSSFGNFSGNFTCIDFSQAMNFELNLNTQKMEKENEKEKCIWE